MYHPMLVMPFSIYENNITSMFTVIFFRHRPLTKIVQQSSDGKYKIDTSSKDFETVSELISNYLTKKEADFPIKECLPPSEYGMLSKSKIHAMPCLVKVDFQEIQCIYYILWFSDRSPLLLCRKSTITDIRNMRITLRSDDAVSSAPQCISARNLQIFRGKRFEYEGKACNVYKGIWKPNKSTNVDVAIKFLKTPNDEKKMKV